MEQTPNLNKALANFRKSIGPIPKNRTAKIPMKSGGNYSYKYADLTDVIEICREPLSENGLFVTQGGQFRDGQWLYVTQVRHSSGEMLEHIYPMREPSADPKLDGSWYTYYRRYSLSAALGLASDEDDDGTGGGAAPKAEPKAKSPVAEKSPPAGKATKPPAGEGSTMASSKVKIAPAAAKPKQSLYEIAGQHGWTNEEVDESIRMRSGSALSNASQLTPSQTTKMEQLVRDQTFGEFHQQFTNS